MASRPERGTGALTSAPPPGSPAAERRPDPGPAPVGPAVHDAPAQRPAETPRDPGPAPVGPAVEHDSVPGHDHSGSTGKPVRPDRA